MKSFIALSVLLAVANAGVILNKPLVNSGAVSGPVHPAVGDFVATKRGPVPISLEGFSEDDNQDGFVDPIGQAVPAVPAVVPAVAPVTYSHPIVTPFVAPVPAVTKFAVPEVKVEVPEVKVEKVEPVAPLVYTNAATVPLTYTHHPFVPAVAAYPAFTKVDVPEVKVKVEKVAAAPVPVVHTYAQPAVPKVKVEKVEAVSPVVYTHAATAPLTYTHHPLFPAVANHPAVPVVSKVDVPEVKVKVEKVATYPVPVVHTYAKPAVPKVKVEAVAPVVYTHAATSPLTFTHHPLAPVVAAHSAVPAVTKVDVPEVKVKVEKVAAAPVPVVHAYAKHATPIVHHTVTHHAPVFHHALPTFAHNNVFAHHQFVNPAVPFAAAAPGVVVENKPKVDTVAVEEA